MAYDAPGGGVGRLRAPCGASRLRSSFAVVQSCSRAVVSRGCLVVALSGVLSRWRGAWADA
eukprot:845242-Prymnesium_polylepis.1